MAQGSARTQACGPTEARLRVDHARSFLEVAELTADVNDLSLEYASVATSVAILARVAAADAVCCQELGRRSRSESHHDAETLPATITPGGERAASRAFGIGCPADHLAWCVHDAVEQIDLGAIYGAYRADGWGRAAFDPQMMVALLLYAYAVGERSSRTIGRRRYEDVAFRVISTNQALDHATIACFRARHEQALAGLFTDVL
jgi:hypothetical protein